MQHLIELSDGQTATLLRVLDEENHTIEDIIMLGVRHAVNENKVGAGLPSFINERCERGDKYYVPVSELKTVVNSTGKHRYGQKAISTYMQSIGIKPKRITIDMVQVRCWDGLRLKGKT